MLLIMLLLNYITKIIHFLARVNTLTRKNDEFNKDLTLDAVIWAIC